MKTQQEVAQIMQETFKRLDKLREAGQKEYAHSDSNALRNFESLSSDLGISREKVLWTYMKKHLDGILSYINGHTSQRESVHGRIDDVHVYLELLRAMVIDNEEKSSYMNVGVGTQQFQGLSNNHLPIHGLGAAGIDHE